MPLAWTIRSERGAAALAAAAPAAPPPIQLVAELARHLAEPRPPLLALELAQAAAALGVSKKFFDDHVRHELRLVRRGRKVLVPVRELERWLSESAALTLEGRR